MKGKATESSLFFPLKKGESPVDKYEEMLFEDKQFFTTKVIHPKVFKNRISKMKLREDAYRQIIHEPAPPFAKAMLVFDSRVKTLDEAYRNFMLFKYSVNRQIYAAQCVNELLYYVYRLLESHFTYCQLFESKRMDDFTTPVAIGKPLGEMEFNLLITRFNELGGKEVDDVFKMDFDGKEALLTEFKRLSLVAKIA